MKKKILAALFAMGVAFTTNSSITEAVTEVSRTSNGYVLVDEASVFWDNNHSFNVLIYNMNNSDEVIGRGVYTFEYLKEYKNWYYHSVNDNSEYIRADVSGLQRVPEVADEVRKQKSFRPGRDKK
jgi:hypothetical protein